MPSGILDEDFPSLSGTKEKAPRYPEPSINYGNIHQKMNKEKSPTKMLTPQEQFPSLGSAASTLMNFREAHSAPSYRNMSGYQPAWNSSKNTHHENTHFQAEKSIKDNSDSVPKMHTLSKKNGKAPAPMPTGLDEFPDLKPISNMNGSEGKIDIQANATNQKKKKNKSKKGQLVGEDLVSVSGSKFLFYNHHNVVP